MPSVAARSPRSWIFLPWRTRSSSIAFSASPSASMSAFLASIIPAPVRSRSALTSLAEISVVLISAPLRRARRPARSRLWSRRRPRARRPARPGPAASACAPSPSALSATVSAGAEVGFAGWRASAPALIGVTVSLPSSSVAGSAGGCTGWLSGGGLLGGGRSGGRFGRGFVLGLFLRLFLGLALGLLFGLALGARFGLGACAFLGLLAGALLLGAEHRVAVGDDLADRLRDQRAGADRVVVARHDEVDAVGVAVGVDEADDRDPQPLRLFDGDHLGFEVDHEHRVGHALHVLDAAEVGAQLRQVGLGGHPLARRQQRELALGLVAFEVVQAADALVDRLEVRQQPAEPAVVDVRHVRRLGDVLDRVAGLLLGADEQHRAAAVGERARELLRLREQGLRLEQVDDVDAAALAEDEAAHLGVPAARLVAEVDAGLQQLRDSYLSHGLLPCSVSVVPCADRADPEAERVRSLRAGPRSVLARVEVPGSSLSGYPTTGSAGGAARSSAACRSSGSGERSSSRSPVIGCSKASRAACRNWRSRPSSPGMAVLGVAGDGMPDRLQVHPDLVRAAGLQPHAQQRGARQRALEREARARLARARAADGHPRAHARVAADGRVDRPRARGRAPLDEREVFAFDLPRRQRGLQAAVGLLAARDHHQARGVAVEPVDDPGALRARRLRASSASSCESVSSRWPRPGCTTSPGPLSITIRCSSSWTIEKLTARLRSGAGAALAVGVGALARAVDDDHEREDPQRDRRVGDVERRPAERAA